MQISKVRLGSTIREKRILKNLTQKQLGSYCGLSRASITNIENGNHNVSLDTFCLIAKALDIEPNLFLREVEGKKMSVSREQLASIAKENQTISELGFYETVSGKCVDLEQTLAESISATKVFKNDWLSLILLDDRPSIAIKDTQIEVVEETTVDGAKRIFETKNSPVLVLNFASAKHPGGGYLRGAKAQEEDISRCSMLYQTQLVAGEYYKKNMLCGSSVYTDTMIYSPNVPFIRNSKYELLEEPFLASVISAPAPNNSSGEISLEILESSLLRRIGYIFSIAEVYGHNHLILGAWGCGVFKNPPELVAKSFDYWIHSDRFKGIFESISFSIYDTSHDKRILEAFRKTINTKKSS